MFAAKVSFPAIQISRNCYCALSFDVTYNGGN